MENDMALIQVGGEWINPKIVLRVASDDWRNERYRGVYVWIEGAEEPLHVYSTTAAAMAAKINEALGVPRIAPEAERQAGDTETNAQ